jgi:predicted deacylase
MSSYLENVVVPLRKFSSPESGPSILIFGGVHGDEPCGQIAVQRLCQALDCGELTLLCGEIVAVERANPEACTRERRSVDEDLNRCFFYHENPTSYEQRVANFLVPYVQQSDFLLDLHSAGCEIDTFIFQDFDHQFSVDIHKRLGVKYLVRGWREAHDRYPRRLSHDTSLCAVSVNKGYAVVECGIHNCPESVEFAWQTVLRLLQEFKMLDGNPLPVEDPEVLQIDSVMYYPPRTTFVRSFSHKDAVKKGEHVATSRLGKKFYAPCDGFTFLPSTPTEAGEGWIYFVGS